MTITRATNVVLTDTFQRIEDVDANFIPTNEFIHGSKFIDIRNISGFNLGLPECAGINIQDRRGILEIPKVRTYHLEKPKENLFANDHPMAIDQAIPSQNFNLEFQQNNSLIQKHYSDAKTTTSSQNLPLIFATEGKPNESAIKKFVELNQRQKEQCKSYSFPKNQNATIGAIFNLKNRIRSNQSEPKSYIHSSIASDINTNFTGYNNGQINDSILCKLNNVYAETIENCINKKSILKMCKTTISNNTEKIIARCKAELTYCTSDKLVRSIHKDDQNDIHFLDSGNEFFLNSRKTFLKDFYKKHEENFQNIENIVINYISSESYFFNDFIKVFQDEALKLENTLVNDKLKNECLDNVFDMILNMNFNNYIIFPGLYAFRKDFTTDFFKFPKNSQNMFIYISMINTLNYMLKMDLSHLLINEKKSDCKYLSEGNLKVIRTINILETELIKILLYVLYPIISENHLKRIVAYIVCEKVLHVDIINHHNNNKSGKSFSFREQVSKRLFLSSFLFCSSEMFVSLFSSTHIKKEEKIIYSFYSKAYLNTLLQKKLVITRKYKDIYIYLENYSKSLLNYIELKNKIAYNRIVSSNILKMNSCIHTSAMGVESNTTDKAEDDNTIANTYKKIIFKYLGVIIDVYRYLSHYLIGV